MILVKWTEVIVHHMLYRDLTSALFAVKVSRSNTDCRQQNSAQ